MHAVRALIFFAIFSLPLAASAAAVSSGGSPFAHVNPFSLGETKTSVSLVQPPVLSQTAAVEGTQGSSPGVKDICYNETTRLTSAKDGGMTQKTYDDKGPNFKKCQEIEGDCKNPEKKKLAGKITYYDVNNKMGTIPNRCNTLAGQNVYCVGDSNCANMKLYAGVSGGDPVYGAKPNDVTAQASSLEIEDPQNAKVILSPGCTNNPSQCLSACSDASSETCPINQQIKELTDKGVLAENIYCMGSGGASTADLDLVTSQACMGDKAQLLGKLSESAPNAVHGTVDDYLRMGAKVGEFEQTPFSGTPSDFNGDYSGGDTTPNNTPFKEQGSYDQVRSLACSVNTEGDCQQFGNSMVATAGAEGAPNGGCSVAGKICGQFQQTDDNYNRGIEAYRSACDSSNEACQLVKETCINGASDRITNNTCSAAAAVGLHAQVSSQIQSQISDPSRQAAAHMLYQLAPGQFMAGQVSDINTYQLSPEAVKAVQNQGISLPANPSGSDAIDGILNKSNMQSGIALANGGSAGSLVGSPTVSKSPGGSVASDKPVTYVVTNKPYEKSFGSSGSMNQMLLGSMLMGPLQNMFKGFGSTGSTYSSNSGATQNPPPPPATLTISAQPPSVARGGTITLTWTSDGTLLNPLCQVTQNGAVIGTGNAGGRSITTSSSTPATLTFTLMCKAAQNGQTVEKSAVVNVQ